MKKNLIIILGDQLSHDIASIKKANNKYDIILMTEVVSEAIYVKHHKKKIAFIFSAMRHFAESLRVSGWNVEYRTLEETGKNGSFTSEIERAVKNHQPDSIMITEPGEWRVLQEIQSWNKTISCPVTVLKDDRFICSQKEFTIWANGRKQLRMEYFYRDMRRKTGLLMEGDEPAGGQWNYDHDNRQSAKPDLAMPQPLHIKPDAITQDVLKLVSKKFNHHFGDLEPFWFATTRADALSALDHFIVQALPYFGTYQDAMLAGEKFLYHSVLSVYLNAGLLTPLEICRRVEAAWKKGAVPLNAAEGYIRQIIGWREYIRGIYWMHMPEYVNRNFFNAAAPLPDFYWTADTKMACLKAAISQTKEEAYAHHIQRLMLTGNFALLAGVSPKTIHEWYLMVYADAYEWVELPNTLGMSQFADGGLLASKPYISSGAYINRMSNYCKGCAYDVKDVIGEKACPFNALYWNFIHSHFDVLKINQRMVYMTSSWNRFDAKKKKAIIEKAEKILNNIDDV